MNDRVITLIEVASAVCLVAGGLILLGWLAAWLAW